MENINFKSEDKDALQRFVEHSEKNKIKKRFEINEQTKEKIVRGLAYILYQDRLKKIETLSKMNDKSDWEAAEIIFDDFQSKGLMSPENIIKIWEVLK